MLVFFLSFLSTHLFSAQSFSTQSYVSLNTDSNALLTSVKIFESLASARKIEVQVSDKKSLAELKLLSFEPYVLPWEGNVALIYKGQAPSKNALQISSESEFLSSLKQAFSFDSVKEQGFVYELAQENGTKDIFVLLVAKSKNELTISLYKNSLTSILETAHFSKKDFSELNFQVKLADLLVKNTFSRNDINWDRVKGELKNVNKASLYTFSQIDSEKKIKQSAVYDFKVLTDGPLSVSGSPTLDSFLTQASFVKKGVKFVLSLRRMVVSGQSELLAYLKENFIRDSNIINDDKDLLAKVSDTFNSEAKSVKFKFLKADLEKAILLVDDVSIGNAVDSIIAYFEPFSWEMMPLNLRDRSDLVDGLKDVIVSAMRLGIQDVELLSLADQFLNPSKSASPFNPEGFQALNAPKDTIISRKRVNLSEMMPAYLSALLSVIDKTIFVDLYVGAINGKVKQWIQIGSES
ncbi:MAG: hypothetical protein HYW47_00910 [Deltaproteobacteria bacterium]|nr:hypothetical protein [Deltaproteobacteria bacterium]